MAHDHDAPVELCAVEREINAPWIVTYLTDHGVPARALPVGILYGSHAAAPHRIVVRRGDLEQARALLKKREEELREFDPAAIDWTQVDTGDDSPLRDDEINPPEPRFFCPDCGYEREAASDVSYCVRCGVRSPLAEYNPRGAADRFAFWVFVVLIAAFIAMLIAGALV